MKRIGQVSFWAGVYILFTLIYKNALTSFSHSLFFVSMLIPVVLATALFFNYFLVPKYLLTNQKRRFAIYSIYTLIGSAYLALIVIFLAFIFLAELKTTQIGPKILDVSNMVVVMYGVVFAHGFLLTFIKYQRTQQQLSELSQAHEKTKIATLTVRTDRQNRPIPLEEILYIESLADYVKIHLAKAAPVITKQKISSFEDSLPGNFIRIHRSFIVNLNNIKSYTKEKIATNGDELPISRKYKSDVLATLENAS